jgi:hypothetical protein
VPLLLRTNRGHPTPSHFAQLTDKGLTAATESGASGCQNWDSQHNALEIDNLVYFSSNR